MSPISSMKMFLGSVLDRLNGIYLGIDNLAKLLDARVKADDTAQVLGRVGEVNSSVKGMTEVLSRQLDEFNVNVRRQNELLSEQTELLKTLLSRGKS